MKIETEDDYSAAIEHVEIAFQQVEYWQEKLYYWSRAVEEYEDIHYPIAKPSLLARIKFRLGQQFRFLNW